MWYGRPNMSEIQKQSTEQTEALINHDFDDIIAMQASSAARRMVEPSDEYSPVSTVTEKDTKKQSANNRLTAVVAGTALVATGGFVAAAGIASGQAPTFSEETKAYTIEPGESIYDAITDTPGLESANPQEVIQNVYSNPANLEALKDGKITPGETIYIPVEINGDNSSDK